MKHIARSCGVLPLTVYFLLFTSTLHADDWTQFRGPNGSGVSNDGALRNISGANSISGAVTLGSAATIGSDAGTLTLSGAFNNGGFLLTETGAGNITLGGVVSGAGGLTINGSGTLTLSGASANTYSGTTTVNSGVLALDKTAASVCMKVSIGRNDRRPLILGVKTKWPSVISMLTLLGIT